MTHKVIGCLHFMGFDVKGFTDEIEADNIEKAFKVFEKKYRFKKVGEFIKSGKTWPWLEGHPDNATIMSVLNVRLDTGEKKSTEEEKLPFERPIETWGKEIIKEEPAPEVKITKREANEKFNKDFEIELEEGYTEKVLPRSTLGKIAKTIWDAPPDVASIFNGAQDSFVGYDELNTNKEPGYNGPVTIIKAAGGHDIKIIRTD